MKRVLNAVLGGCLLVASCAAPKKDTITIKGKVQFPDNQFNMEIVERNGFDKTIIDSCKVNADGTYQFTMKVDRPGVYTLECQKWQSVQFWAEDEDLEINFRGMDTARIKIKNPPYVHINGGPNNEVMNLLNWDSYRCTYSLALFKMSMYSCSPTCSPSMGLSPKGSTKPAAPSTCASPAARGRGCLP